MRIVFRVPCPGCCSTNPCQLPDNLDAVISGVVSCGCRQLAPTQSRIVVSISGINGSFTASYNAGSNAWVVDIGSYIQHDHVLTGDCTDGSPQIFEYFVTLFITCVEGNVPPLFAVAVVNLDEYIDHDTYPPSGAVLQVSAELDVAANFPDCETGGGADDFIGDGSITISEA